MKRMQQQWLMVLMVLLLTAGCGARPSPTGAGAPGPVPDGISASAQESALTPSDTEWLRPGDAVRLRIWREPELSGEFTIDRRGLVVLPKLGEVAATELTPSELEERIRQDYARYLRNPSIEIVMLRRINILGAVRSPGLYPVDPTMTLTDALAAAGGVLPNGRQDQVELLRDEERVVAHVTGETRIFDLGLRSGDQLYISERTWMSRNAGVIATVASTVISATVSLIIAFSR